MSRDNMEGAEIRNCLFGAGNKYKATTLTLAGAYTLAGLTTEVMFVDPGGAIRNFTLPAMTAADIGARLVLVHTGGAFDITVKNSGASTIGTLSTAETATMWWDGTTWRFTSAVA